MTPAPVLNQPTVLAALRQVIDPEIGCNIADLGLIYNIAIADAKVSVQMTLTTPGCPMGERIAQGAQWAVLGIAGVEAATVEIVWGPAVAAGHDDGGRTRRNRHALKDFPEPVNQKI